jgi:cytochrome oxidase Cu insertion factor (SCO1/SenC/PrrC family)
MTSAVGWTIGATYRKLLKERRTMRTGFAIFFVVTFVLMFVVACNGQDDSKNKEETTKEETTAAPDTKVKEETVEVEQETTVEKDLPKSGGPTLGVLALPAAALLVSSGILGYAVLRRR